MGDDPKSTETSQYCFRATVRYPGYDDFDKLYELMSDKTVRLKFAELRRYYELRRIERERIMTNWRSVIPPECPARAMKRQARAQKRETTGSAANQKKAQ